MLGRGDTSGSQVTTSSSIAGSRRDGREERHGLGLTATSTAERFALAITFLVAAAGSLFLTLGLDLQHSPDVTLYTSGFSLFPSPLGTALGTLLGIEGLAIVQAVVIGAVAVSIVVLRVPCAPSWSRCPCSSGSPLWASMSSPRRSSPGAGGEHRRVGTGSRPAFISRHCSWWSP